MPIGQTQALGGGMNYVNTMQPGQEGVLRTGSGMIADLLRSNPNENPFMPMSPNATATWWNQYMRPEAESQFQNRTLPATREAFVGPGTYWGGARAQAESDARTNFENNQSRQIGDYYMRSRELANNALLPFAAQLLNANTGMVYGQQGQSGGGMGGLGDLLRQLLERGLNGQGQDAGGQAAVPAGQNPNFDWNGSYPWGPLDNAGGLFSSPYSEVPQGPSLGGGGLFDYEGGMNTLQPGSLLDYSGLTNW